MPTSPPPISDVARDGRSSTDPAAAPETWAIFERRSFLAMFAAAAMMGITDCDTKRAKKPKPPTATLVRGAGGTKKRIKKYVGDKKRREAALAKLKEGTDTIGKFSRIINEARDARARLPPERQTREELMAVIEE